MHVKPPDVFDRDEQWAALTAFATDPREGATLAVVSGRRRQGKSFLLQAAVEAAGGFYFEATEDVEAVALRRFGAELGAFSGSPGSLRFDTWSAAVDALLALGEGGSPVLAVLDEFPYLLAASPSLSSVIQHAYGPRRDERLASRTRVVLCGSAFSVMGSMMSGQAPLRGRAAMEMAVRPFDFRLSRSYWRIADLETAFMVHAVVGGTPAYREMSLAIAPQAVADFDRWVIEAILSPYSALCREPRYLFSEDLPARDVSTYQSIMAAIARGQTSRGKVAAAVGRQTTDLAHPLRVLQDSGFIVRESDALGASRRPIWRIADPIMAFYYAVTRPVWARIEHGSGLDGVWLQRRPAFDSQVLGPHFEQVCRDWAMNFAAPETFGIDLVTDVGQAVLHSGTPSKPQRQIDVVVQGRSRGGRRIAAIGEAKWGERITMAHFNKLAAARVLMAERGLDVSATRLVLFSGVGFDGPVLETDAVLVDLRRLYSGE